MASSGRFLLVLLACCYAAGVSEAARQRRQARPEPKHPPNIFLVMADDLDVGLGSMQQAMNETLKFFNESGATFSNSFVTTPVCCPSRSSMLSGLYAHNHGALTNNEECNGEFWRKNIENKTIGVRMQRAGYFTGKPPFGYLSLSFISAFSKILVSCCDLLPLRCVVLVSSFLFLRAFVHVKVESV